MQVYRIQINIDKCGHMTHCGPFNAGVFKKEVEPLCWRYKDGLGWVNEPENDHMEPPLKSMGGKISGFELKNLRQWIPMRGLWKEMYEAGFRICAYEVPDEHLHRGETQVAFHPDVAKIVDSDVCVESLMTLWKQENQFPELADFDDFTQDVRASA